MKTSLVFFVVAVLTSTYAEITREDFQRFDNECHSTNALTPNILCMNVKFGVMKPNGDIDRNDFKAALKNLPFFDSALIEDAAADCGERRGSTAAEAAEALNACLKKFVTRRVP